MTHLYRVIPKVGFLLANSASAHSSPTTLFAAQTLSAIDLLIEVPWMLA